MRQYRVDKDAVGATVYLSDGAALRGSLFLSPFSIRRAGRQSVAELLAETGAALPFANPEGKFLLLGTASIAAVELAEAGPADEGFWTRIPMKVRLVGGHVFGGALLLEEGAGPRVSDVVRTEDPWLALETPGTRLWVAKAHLLILEPEGDGRPPRE